MAGSTFKWLGGQGGTLDPNDATAVANWLIDQGGSFIAAAATPGGGTVAIAAGSALFIKDTTAWTTPIAFAQSGGGTLILSTAAAEQGGLPGFVPQAGGSADTIDLLSVHYLGTDQQSLVGGVLTLLDAANHKLATLDLGVASAADYTVQSNGHGGTEIVSSSVPCYVAGTRIATPGGPRNVEDLRAGDLVLVQRGGALVPEAVR